MNDKNWWKSFGKEPSITLLTLVFSILFFGVSGIALFSIQEIEQIIPIVVNTLLAVLAFWYTLETRLMRKEANNQLVLLQEQGELFKIQSFESTFFQLLQLHLKIADNLRYVRKDITYLGRTCFSEFYAELTERYVEVFLNSQSTPYPVDKAQALEIEKGLIDKAFEKFYRAENRDRLGHYFRNLYHLIQFIHTAEEIVDKQKYANLIRAQLSSHEEMLIFYHAQFYSHHYKIALSGNREYERYRTLLKTYNLLEGVVLDMFLDASAQVEQRSDTKHFSIYAGNFIK